ncbi:hypothetical protein EGN72_08825 [Pseudorhodobacter sp. E13]|uniref:zinc-binding metallopeptidase family protein n=1 Tax=Pseudorhodobacter sp. E13 TaxID=2487931 RepID=UPI000F8DE633|nr:putative zinc-binding metallopeptidase [Pseudorhodobacter sp. E13]RUS60319.1 hypothetical protein EGN72_08825 [Pseudorhodobacter sp. E13]
MRRFQCPVCTTEVHFGNSHCGHCGAGLGYLPRHDQMQALPLGGGSPTPCANREVIGCNWLCDSGGDGGGDGDGNGGASLCLSCRHTMKIPNTADTERQNQWARLERAKRRLFYSLLKFNLPLSDSPDGTAGSLQFELLGDETRPDGAQKRVMTGHDNGRITINIDEADDVTRERNRAALGEPYRTLIGHFRHEVAHYYWDKLIAGTDRLAACRACFGDEQQDYAQSLAAHYANGPAPDWPQSFVSAYASAHPWEDFAETWAHYFHMVGGLETAQAYGLDPKSLTEPAAQASQASQTPLAWLPNPYHATDCDELIARWVPLTIAMNAMNRSMGNRDYYPFVLTPAIARKLRFIHDLIAGS